ncbi:MAG: sulfatase-like hydrolase/transferase [Acidobacteria bacterium]|nr:sulfatase-like hydrolase/transferase [Acidobacteriota bacterium]
MFRSAPVLLLLALLGCGGAEAPPPAVERPNIVLLMTDDQGWAQLGSHGDDVLKTPNLDKLAAESVEFERFYVSPVCAPTRASLMTGRYNYRTGVVDTYLGRAMMAPDEVTIAELLGEAGYRTGIFGKWHLGDNYPMRAMDQGFDRAIVIRGGGIGQPSDPPGSDYFDPILFDNGEQKKYQGYCTDVYFQEATRFIDESGDKPFFVYLPTNAPHAPYRVADSYREPYAALGLDDKDARIYGMITNIDDNVGRLLAHLDEKGLRDNTIFIFMTDNGPTTRRFTAGLRAQKASTYENGIRVPFFFRWPAKLQPRKVQTIGAHIDVLPTLLEAAGVQPPSTLHLDGRSLMPLLELGDAAPWRDRRLFIQSHRGNIPERGRNATVIGQQYKLVQPLSFGQPPPPDAQWEYYDLNADPGEALDISSKENQRDRDNLQRDYEVWFREVSETRGYEPQRIWLGAEEENPTVLTRQDWRILAGPDGWGKGSYGEWAIDCRRDGLYKAIVDFDEAEAPGRAEVKFGAAEASKEYEAGATRVELEGLRFQRGLGNLGARLVSRGQVSGARMVTMERIGDLPPQ